MNPVPDFSDLDIHAYVDGEMDAGRARAIGEAASRDAALAARIGNYRADKALLKGSYSPLADEPLPQAWLALINGRTVPARTRHSWRSSARMAGAIAAMLLVVGGGLGFYSASTRQPAGDVVAAALEARDQAGVAVAGLGDARRYDGTLGRIVNANIKVPDLERMGYRVDKLVFYDRAAEVQYRDRQNNLFTLYLRASDGKTRFDQFEQKGLRICVWQDDRISTVMAGAMSAAEMQRLASLAYLGLTA